MKRKTTLLWAVILLLLSIGSAWALEPRINWNPGELKPFSLAPGETKVFSLTIRNGGWLPIPVTQQLQVMAEGAIVPFVTIEQPQWPVGVFKRHDTVMVPVTVAVPVETPLSIVTGDLVVRRVLPNGKTKEIFRSSALPVELTFSSVPLPPDPGEAGKADLLGIDLDNDLVRDDIHRWIAFNFSNSVKVQEALKQGARALNAYLRDAEDRAKTRENGKADDQSIDCLQFVFNGNLDLSWDARKQLRAQFLNTSDRSRAYKLADLQMSGYVSDYGPANEEWSRISQSCTFNPDTLPN